MPQPKAAGSRSQPALRPGVEDDLSVVIYFHEIGKAYRRYSLAAVHWWNFPAR